MGRLSLKNQKNTWGRNAADGLDAQRVDLWTVDFTNPLAGISSQLERPLSQRWVTQLAKSVTFPEIKVKAETYLRNNVPVQMPAEDEPLSEIKVSFILPVANGKGDSLLLDLLEIWHDLVRAGRGLRRTQYAGIGPSSNKHLLLDANYKSNCTFDFAVTLYKGMTIGEGGFSSFTEDLVNFDEPTLEISYQYVIKSAWLSSFKLADADYSKSDFMTVDASFFAEDFYEANRRP